MDPLNPVHTKLTYRITRAEHVAMLVILSALVIWHYREVNWWRFAAAFWIIDLAGYLPGAILYRRLKTGRAPKWCHNIYNIAHTYLVTGTGVALWALAEGGFEWAMLGVPIHLAIDRGVFGNTLKPVELSFEPRRHSDDELLQALGRREGNAAGNDSPSSPIEIPAPADIRADEQLPREPLAHPSGYLALSRRNQIFTVPGLAGCICYRVQGKHYWMFGGVHAEPDAAPALLDQFLDKARQQRKRVAAVQVRQEQVELFASRGFKVNQMGASYAVQLAGFSLKGGQKMQLRNKIQKAKKMGLTVVELGREAPRDEAAFRELEQVSQAWLSGKGKKELDFMIGELGGPADVERRIFVVRDAEQQPLAFITYVPVEGEQPGYLHDLTRKTPQAPSGVMELCNAFAIERFRSEGVSVLHFGFTPFMVDDQEPTSASRLVTRLIAALRKHGRRIYPAESQAAYKMKWGVDIIQREYIAASKVSLRAAWDLLALTRSV